jgi:hypothetical protein
MILLENSSIRKGWVYKHTYHGGRVLALIHN